MSDALVDARSSLSSLRAYAAQVEDGDRVGDLAQLLCADAIASATLAVADALRDWPIGVLDVNRV